MTLPENLSPDNGEPVLQGERIGETVGIITSILVAFAGIVPVTKLIEMTDKIAETGTEMLANRIGAVFALSLVSTGIGYLVNRLVENRIGEK